MKWFAVALLTACAALAACAAGAVTVNYGDVGLSGGYQAGHFSDVWDLTAGDVTISSLYDGYGLVDEYGGNAHAWAELGVRAVGYGDFNPTPGTGLWLATDYDWTVNTFDPDPEGKPTLDMDDKLILQRRGGYGEGDYNLPSTPPAPGNNHRVWFDRDGVDPWQGDWPAVDGGTFNTEGTYEVVLKLHADDEGTGTAYMSINGLDQGFEVDGEWSTIELTPAGMTFTGDMRYMQVFYGIYGYGATHSVRLNNITVTGTLTAPYYFKLKATENLQALKPTGKPDVDKVIDNAIAKIQKSLTEEWWIDDTHLTREKGHYVFDNEKAAAKALMDKMKDKKLPADIRAAFLEVITMLLDVDEMLAQVQIDDAKDAGGNPAEIALAEAEMAKAQSYRDAGKYTDAIEHYKKAWEHAYKAMDKFGLAGVQAGLERSPVYTFALSRNNPNPVSRETSISFTLPVAGHAMLDIYDATGRLVETLVDEEMSAGAYTVTWDREGVSSGVYFYRLSSNGNSLTKKMVVVR
jgi:hypothetical protein